MLRCRTRPYFVQVPAAQRAYDRCLLLFPPMPSAIRGSRVIRRTPRDEPILWDTSREEPVDKDPTLSLAAIEPSRQTETFSSILPARLSVDEPSIAPRRCRDSRCPELGQASSIAAPAVQLQRHPIQGAGRPGTLGAKRQGERVLVRIFLLTAIC